MGTTFDIASPELASKRQPLKTPQDRRGKTRWRSIATRFVFAAAAILANQPVLAAGPGDDEIRIGNTMPYSGPASAYGVIGKTLSAYFDKVNAEGGINGRRIRFISYDDAYNPAKTIELVHKLVEQDRVLLMFGSVGGATSAAVRPYLNSSKVPQLFNASGPAMWDQPQEFPWTMGWQPNYQTEGRIYAQYLLENYSSGRIAVLYQDDAFGNDALKGLKDGLGGKIQMVVAPYKVTDPSIDPQLARLKASGADIFVNFTTPKFATIAIRRVAEMGWKPVQLLEAASNSVAVLRPAGLENAEGVLSAGYYLEPDDPATANDPAYREWYAFMERYAPSLSKSDGLTSYSYALARTMVEVLRRSGNDLSRENVMRQAASLKALQIPMLLPGIAINTSPADYAPIEQMQMQRFTGGRWERFGPVRSGIDAGSVSESFKTIFQYGTAKRDLAVRTNANTVSVMTGSFGSTYAQIGADLGSVLDNGESLRVLPFLGRGSVQAVSDILLLRGVDAGIVRKDTLAYLERKDFAANMRAQFVYVTKLFNEEMHVLASQSVRSMKELDGKTVVVDQPDSSTFVTAINVFERLGIKPHLVYSEPRLAVDQLRRGEVDAILAVEGKPSQWLSQIRDADLHLVPVEYDRSLQSEYLPSKLTAEDYPNLVTGGAVVDTIAAEAILAAYHWPANNDRYRRLSLLVESLFTKLPRLQQPPFHPKWKEVSPRVPVEGWTRFEAAQEWLNRAYPTASTGAGAPATTVGVGSSRDAGPPISRNDPLYREFLDWRANRQKANR
jgi:branched-chain amino acid transport system substrate-binding protein